MPTNIDPAIVEALRPWFEDDAPDAAHEVLQVIRPTLAAAVDAARAEGDKQGAARVREAVEAALTDLTDPDGDFVPCVGPCDHAECDTARHVLTEVRAALTEAAPHD